MLTTLCGEPDNATQNAAIVGAVVSSVGCVPGEASIDRAVGCQSDEYSANAVGFAANDDITEEYTHTVRFRAKINARREIPVTRGYRPTL